MPANKGRAKIVEAARLENEMKQRMAPVFDSPQNGNKRKIDLRILRAGARCPFGREDEYRAGRFALKLS